MMNSVHYSHHTNCLGPTIFKEKTRFTRIQASYLPIGEESRGKHSRLIGMRAALGGKRQSHFGPNDNRRNVYCSIGQGDSVTFASKYNLAMLVSSREGRSGIDRKDGHGRCLNRNQIKGSIWPGFLKCRSLKSGRDLITPSCGENGLQSHPSIPSFNRN